MTPVVRRRWPDLTDKLGSLVAGPGPPEQNVPAPVADQERLILPRNACSDGVRPLGAGDHALRPFSRTTQAITVAVLRCGLTSLRCARRCHSRRRTSRRQVAEERPLLRRPPGPARGSNARRSSYRSGYGWAPRPSGWAPRPRRSRVALRHPRVTGKRNRNGSGMGGLGGDPGRRAHPGAAFGIDQLLQLAAIQEEPAALAALVEVDAAALVGDHFAGALGAAEGSGGGHRSAPSCGRSVRVEGKVRGRN